MASKGVSCRKSIALLLICDWIITEVKIYFFVITSFVSTNKSRLVRFFFKFRCAKVRTSLNNTNL